MNKVKIQNKEFLLSGTIIKKGEHISFKAEDLFGNDFNLKDVKGMKVISVFPDITTSVCDVQTKKIQDLALQYPKTTFISISMNPISVFKDWCGNNNVSNIGIVSDCKYKEFAKLTNLYIPEIDKLSRAIIVLDNDNKILSIKASEEIVDHLDFSELDKYLKI